MSPWITTQLFWNWHNTKEWPVGSAKPAPALAQTDDQGVIKSKYWMDSIWVQYSCCNWTAKQVYIVSRDSECGDRRVHFGKFSQTRHQMCCTILYPPPTHPQSECKIVDGTHREVCLRLSMVLVPHLDPGQLAGQPGDLVLQLLHSLVNSLQVADLIPNNLHSVLQLSY